MKRGFAARFTALAAVGVLALVGCNDDNGDDGDNGGTTPSPAEQTTEPAGSPTG